VVQLLVEEGQADMSALNDEGANVLYWPVYYGRNEVVDYLLKRGSHSI
jgi:ankyrin repeat protein